MNPFADFLLACAAPVERQGLDRGLGAICLGVGKVAATIGLLDTVAARRPRGLLLFGVAGAFPERHRPSPPPVGLGEVCLVETDSFGDEGVETPTGFASLAKLGLGEVGSFRADEGLTGWAASTLSVPLVRGVTVSSGSGTDETSRRMAERSGADVETMEGAAVALTCRHLGLPFVQLRAISNWTGDRERGGWNLPAAVQAVQAALRRVLGEER